jgi:putative hydrolase of the HAD superfamily
MAEGFFGVDWQGTLLEEVPDLLKTLRERGYRLGIVSNWGSDSEAYCQELGIAHHFTRILASQAVGIGKPHPQIFELVLERLEVAPSEAVQVGDNHYPMFSVRSG